ncbi:ferric reductase-like transmembrane domain-containing protein, partial [Bordetella pertussis]
MHNGPGANGRLRKRHRARSGDAMRRLRTIFILLVAALSVLWLSQNPPGAWGEGFWVMRKPLIYYTGILALGMMSLGVILAARPARFEGALGGLDKFYRLHKWLGLGGVALALTHWLLKIVPPWMAAQGWTVRPPRVPAPAGQAALYDPFQAWHGVAK